MTWVTPEPDPDDGLHIGDDGKHVVDDGQPLSENEQPIGDAAQPITDTPIDADVDVTPDLDSILAAETPEERERRLAELVAQEELAQLARLDASRPPGRTPSTRPWWIATGWTWKPRWRRKNPRPRSPGRHQPGPGH